MSRQERAEEERRRRREGREGPGSARRSELGRRLEQLRLKERVREAEFESGIRAEREKRLRRSSSSSVPIVRACKLSLFVGDVS